MTRVIVKAGSIVDSVTIHTMNGQILRAGGQGGGPAVEWKLFDKDYSLASIVGFFGGTGGHLHNLGVVLRKERYAGAATILPPAPPTASLPLQLFSCWRSVKVIPLYASGSEWHVLLYTACAQFYKIYIQTHVSPKK